MQPQQINHNRRNATPVIAQMWNGPLLHPSPQNLTAQVASEQSTCAKSSMRSFIAPKPPANGECCQKIFLTGGMSGTTTICGLKMARGKHSTTHCESVCDVKKDAMRNHRSASSIVKQSRPLKLVANVASMVRNRSKDANVISWLISSDYC